MVYPERGTQTERPSHMQTKYDFKEVKSALKSYITINGLSSKLKVTKKTAKKYLEAYILDAITQGKKEPVAVKVLDRGDNAFEIGRRAQAYRAV